MRTRCRPIKSSCNCWLLLFAGLLDVHSSCQPIFITTTNQQLITPKRPVHQLDVFWPYKRTIILCLMLITSPKVCYGLIVFKNVDYLIPPIIQLPYGNRQIMHFVILIKFSRKISELSCVRLANSHICF